ncbi:MAG: T9SS type A sorting domain-containing protein [Saprospiraceae bacterium]
MKKILFATCFFAFLFATVLNAQALISATAKGSRTKAQLAAQFRNLANNDVDLFKISYSTTDVFGQLDTASGLVVIPRRQAIYKYPTLVFQHGTVGSRNDVPSNLRGGYDAGLFFAGLGYIALLPDYLGLGDSRGLHPYVHADSEASAAIDMLHAAKTFLQQQNTLANGQLFITGYSQGGHGAMALHRALEAEESQDFQVTAAAPMSGPYSISGVMRDKITLSDDPYYYPAYVHYTIISYNYVYGLYDDIDQVFKPDYTPALRQFLKEEISLGELNSALIAKLIENHGASIPKYMLQDSIIAAVLSDETHPFNMALRDNDVYDWAPQAPTRLYYCMADDQVAYANSLVAAAAMTSNGAADFDALDVDSNADHGQCIEPAFLATAIFFGQYWDVSLVANQAPRASLPLTIFPNPTADWITLSGITTASEVEVFNGLGQRVLRQQVTPGEAQLSLAALLPGTYYVQVKMDAGIGVGSILKK